MIAHGWARRFAKPADYALEACALDARWEMMTFDRILDFGFWIHFGPGTRIDPRGHCHPLGLARSGQAHARFDYIWE